MDFLLVGVWTGTSFLPLCVFFGFLVATNTDNTLFFYSLYLLSLHIAELTSSKQSYLNVLINVFLTLLTKTQACPKVQMCETV